MIVGPDQRHISYVHSPMRYAWDLQHQYLAEEKLTGVRGFAARLMLHYLRLWDQSPACRAMNLELATNVITRHAED